MPFSNYQPERMGSAVIEPGHARTAGELDEFTLTYTAGTYGIDDSGMIKISWRTTSDMEKPQFDQPEMSGYTTIEASNGAVLECWVDRVNIRPWTNSIVIRVGRGYLREHDTITVRFGDRRYGSPGIRLQTNAERRFAFKIYVDAFAAYEFVEIADAPGFALVAGAPAQWKAVVPSLLAAGEPFDLSIVACDRWGNPTRHRRGQTVLLSSNGPVSNLPERTALDPEKVVNVVGPLVADAPADIWFTLTAPDKSRLCLSNPLRVESEPGDRRYWGDLHGQSEETVGTNSAEEHFRFARDFALLDIAGHQGNDFQIDDAFWAKLNEITARFEQPGTFLAVPGYEWSGNTGLGGDRNVFYRQEGRPIFRSSHILIDDGAETPPCPTATDLFAALDGEDAVVIAHVGGRYADILYAHDVRLETSVEIHSSWGTFEWLLHDALSQGFRVGVVCHSDDHKGRPGATSPGASSFGAIGGLTCYLMPELSRDALFACLRSRHHYGTTGTRIYLDVRGNFPTPAQLYLRDPALGGDESRPTNSAMMGDIVRPSSDTMNLDIDVLGTAPLSEIAVFSGTTPIAVFRPGNSSGSRRIALRWEGAEYRGRGRETLWNGEVRVAGNRILKATGVNFLNPELAVDEVECGTNYRWKSVTTGNLVGLDLVLERPDLGRLSVATNHATLEIDLCDILEKPVVQNAGGLSKTLSAFRIAENGGPLAFKATCHVSVGETETPVYVRVTQEDCNRAWSSPIYALGATPANGWPSTGS